MTTYCTAIAIGALAYVVAAATAHAEPPPDCGTLESLLEYHASEYDERIVWMGYSEEYDSTTIILAEPGGGWSELQSDGADACLIDYGHSSVSDFGKKGERA